MPDWTEKNPIEPKRTRRELHDLPALPSLGGSAPTPTSFQTTLTDAQIDARCVQPENIDRFALKMALITAEYARQLADHPQLAAHESSWLMGARDAIYWLAEKVVTERAARATLPSEGARPEVPDARV